MCSHCRDMWRTTLKNGTGSNGNEEVLHILHYLMQFSVIRRTLYFPVWGGVLLLYREYSQGIPSLADSPHYLWSILLETLFPFLSPFPIFFSLFFFFTTLHHSSFSLYSSRLSLSVSPLLFLCLSSSSSVSLSLLFYLSVPHLLFLSLRIYFSSLSRSSLLYLFSSLL